MKEEQELSQCTFRPLISTAKLQAIDNSAHSMYDRATLWKMERDLKIEQEKKMNETQELKECSFVPSI